MNELSFLDIEYAWTNKDKTVFFISQSQYNFENINRFNSIKLDNWFLAIATNGYETYKRNINDFDLSIYQHGYYDLLLNSDYEIIPYKRQYYSFVLPKCLTIEELKQRFAYNERRLYLYNNLIEIIKRITYLIKIQSIKITGSYLEEKEKPNDLDVIICINQNELKKIENDANLKHKYNILINSQAMKQLGFDLHIKVLIEKDIDLDKCHFDEHDESNEYLCKRGYYIALFSQKTIYHDNGYDCYIRNIINLVI